MNVPLHQHSLFCHLFSADLFLHLCQETIWHICVGLGFPGSSDSKESTCNAGDLGWEDPLEEGMANPVQYSCLENPHGQRSLAGYSSWGCKESDTTERLSTA